VLLEFFESVGGVAQSGGAFAGLVLDAGGEAAVAAELEGSAAGGNYVYATNDICHLSCLSVCDLGARQERARLCSEKCIGDPG
jgi:hypothetical protein